MLPPLLVNPLRQDFARDAFDGLLACGVNVEDEQRIGVGEGGRESFHQVARARVAMRLEDDVNLAKTALPRRGQRGLDLSGMVPVIVDHTHARVAPAQLEAPVNAAELVERRANLLDAN